MNSWYHESQYHYPDFLHFSINKMEILTLRFSMFFITQCMFASEILLFQKSDAVIFPNIAISEISHSKKDAGGGQET